MYNFLKHTLLLFSLLNASLAFGQTDLQVVSKKVEKSFNYLNIKEVQVDGDKADINIETWAKKEIKVELELIAKHPDLETAKMDIKELKYVIEKDNKVVLVRNFIGSKDKQIKAELRARIKIQVPEECPVKITNYFGKSVVNNLENRLQVNSQFSPVSLNNVQGQVGVNSKYGDIVGERLNGDVKIISHRSNVTLRQIEGKYDIQSKYGIIKIFADRRRINLNVNADKSDIYFFNPEPSIVGYELTAHYGNITVPTDLKMNFIEDSEALRHAVFSPPSEHGKITLKINFGDIIVRNLRP